ncbi:hypothetical protein QJS04_geneDACA011646 [Acorus gramineus]|uniref:Uncharacterized protein n=1 Tax=Acorus gramineus TaxID=55184 RepID=A0AAV9BEP1_ACOGR|nr:hypothetical protein QJS04_geneDACA011646 [Acorus gramineus]
MQEVFQEFKTGSFILSNILRASPTARKCITNARARVSAAQSHSPNLLTVHHVQCNSSSSSQK